MDDIIITKLAPRLIERVHSDELPVVSRLPIEPLTVPVEREPLKLSLWQKARLAPYIIHTLWGVLMKNPKTTITGIVGGLAYIVNTLLGVVIPSEAIITVTVFVLSLFAGDGKED